MSSPIDECESYKNSRQIFERGGYNDATLFMFENDTEVAILGGGCAAIWLSYELTRQHYSCTLIEDGPMGAHASQKNQSWLHTGALYSVVAAEEDDQTKREAFRELAKACFKSSTDIRRFARRFCPSALDWRSGCLFLYEDEGLADKAESMLQSYGLAPRKFHEGIELLEPILRGSPLKVGLATPDLPFDAGLLLQTVLNLSISRGAQVADSKQALQSLRIERQNEYWIIRGNRIHIRAKVVIAAVGALANSLTSPLSLQKPLQMQKCTVAVLHRRVCNRMLVVRSRNARFLNLVPFRGGTTVNLGLNDESLDACTDYDPPKEAPRQIAKSLALYCPGLARNKAIGAHFYVCQKVAYMGSVTRSPRHYFWFPLQDHPVYYFYPGKFTLASLATKNFVREITRHLNVGGPLGSRTEKWRMAVSPYRQRATHILMPSIEKTLDMVQLP